MSVRSGALLGGNDLRGLAFLFAAATLAVTGAPDRSTAQNLSTFGTPGLIDMPTADVLPDGELGFTISHFGATTRSTAVFQIFPRLYGSFRYSFVDDLLGPIGGLYDRSFDVHYQLREESKYWPAIAVGLRDILGTGLYSGEYIVATKTFNDRFRLTGGVGWGRLAQRNTVSNPLCFDNNRFCTRPIRSSTTGQGGTLQTGNWFRGPMGVFGGASWDYNDRLTLMAEISSDAYREETIRAGGVIDINSPVNLGVSYRLGRGTQLSGYFIQGSEIGLQLSYVVNPKEPRNNAGTGTVAPAIVPVDQVALASWNLPDRAPDQPDARDVIKTRLSEQGLTLEGYQIRGDTVVVHIDNRRYDASAQAVGRTNHVLANTLPAEVTKFEVVLVRGGVPITNVKSNRADLADLKNDIDGPWRSLSRTQFEDGAGSQVGRIEGVYPKFSYRLGPYAAFSFFDPLSPVRADFGVQLRTDFTIQPGLTLAGQLRYPIVGNIDGGSVSSSALPRVRTDWPVYAQQSDLEVNYLTAEYIWRPRENFFARVTGGYLENMYGGVSAELLWFPTTSRLALGGELNWSRQREFDMLFDFRDYNVTTGHASAYYDFGNGFLGQVDMGRYLAGDWGATFTVNREFNNGLKVGAFFTLTDVPFDTFGEGSFDKGITMQVPLSWLTGRPSKRNINQTVRTILRDGGARLNVRNRLYNYTRNDRATRVADRWGRYYR
ncbi:MAG: YjbH domain-containing protein [Paracoccaceae bacterium]